MLKLECTSCGASTFDKIEAGLHKPTLKCQYCGSIFYDPDLGEYNFNSPGPSTSFAAYPTITSGSASFITTSSRILPMHNDFNIGVPYGLGESNLNPGDIIDPQKKSFLARIFG